MITQIITTHHKNRVNIQTLGKMELKDMSIRLENRDESYRKIVSEITGIETSKVFLLNQTHKTDFYSTDELKLGKILEGDGLYTFNRQEVLVVKTADCIPIFLWSYKVPFIGIIHAGWKGLKDNFVKKFSNFIYEKYSHVDLNLYIGPSIRKQNYQVKDDVAQYFKDGLGTALVPKKDDHYLLGLDEILKYRLMDENLIIQDCNICTYSNPNYYSHRRGDKERNLSFIYID